MKKRNAPAVLGIGVDIEEVARVRRLCVRASGFLKRFFTPEEAACCRGPHGYERLAARFAAKEAVIKALDRKDLPLKSVAVSNSPTGRPEVSVKAPGLKGLKIMISLSHTRRYACASAVVFRQK